MVKKKTCHRFLLKLLDKGLKNHSMKQKKAKANLLTSYSTNWKLNISGYEYRIYAFLP